MWWFLPCILGFIRLYLDGVKVLLYQLFNKSFNLPDLPKQNGKVAIVTGGARGMGYEISRHLVSLDMHVIIAGNKEEEGLAAVKKIQELNQGKDGISRAAVRMKARSLPCGIHPSPTLNFNCYARTGPSVFTPSFHHWAIEVEK